MYMKTLCLVIFLSLVGFCESHPETFTLGTTPENIERAVILDLINLSEDTTLRVREIYDEFQGSFIDYEPAIQKINVLINDYNNTIQSLSEDLPAEGGQLDELIKKLLSRIEKYFVHWKSFGRANPYINAQIYQVMAEIGREKERLIFLYM